MNINTVGARRGDRFVSRMYPHFLRKVRAVMEDRNRFWFGLNWIKRCKSGTYWESIDCYNPNPREFSISDRLFGRGRFRPNTIDRFLHVNYISPAGNYTGCNDDVTIPDTVAFAVYPTSYKTHHPWHTRKEPYISWSADANKYYTVMIIDVGFGKIHGHFVDIKGNDLRTARTVIAYRGPDNFRDQPNPYVFLLFEQRRKNPNKNSYGVGLEESDTIWSSKLRRYINRELIGPKALNILTSSFDKYSVQQQVDRGFANNCPYYVRRAVRDKSQKPFRGFLPYNSKISTFLNITMVTPKTEFDVCCKHFEYDEGLVSLNPIGSGLVNSYRAKTGIAPKVTISAEGMFPDARSDFRGTYHTLMFLAADVADKTAGTFEKPLLHWFVTNIEDGDFETGIQLANYIGPLPPDGRHYYHFALFHHSRKMSQENMDNVYRYAGEQCNPLFKGRCLFDVDSFIDYHEMSLVGITWMTVQPDPYVMYKYAKILGFGEEAVCGGFPGYSAGCVTKE